jgi:hypothetical protein
MPSNPKRASKAFLLVILLGIIGGVLVTVGFFLPWEAYSPGFGPSTLIRVRGLDNKPVASVVEQTLDEYLNMSVSVTITEDNSLITGKFGFDAEVGQVIPENEDNQIIGFISTQFPNANTLVLPRESFLARTVKFSGWDILRENILHNIGFLLNWLGGVLVLLGGTALAIRVKNAVYLILVGGILAVLGIFVSINSIFSYGYYMSLVGSILCIISGVVGLKMLP